MDLKLGDMITVCDEWKGRKSDIPFYLITYDPRVVEDVEENYSNIIDFHQDYCGVVVELGEVWYGNSSHQLVKLIVPNGTGYLTSPNLETYIRVIY